MPRIQLAINVTDLDNAIRFYSPRFDTAPAKVKPGRANSAIADPPLKLVSFEGKEGTTFNRPRATWKRPRRLRGAGLETIGVENTIFCYAGKTETWVSDPNGALWKW